MTEPEVDLEKHSRLLVWVVVIVCLVVGVGLLACRGLLRAAGVGWLVGCVLYTSFGLWLVSMFPNLG